MKTLIVILLFLIGNSCEPSTEEAPIKINEASTESIESNDSNTNLPIQDAMNPGEISLKVQVMEIYDSNKDICGISKTNVMKIAVQEITGRGSSIVNVPNKNDEVLVYFMVPPEEVAANSLIKVKARESLCKDTSRTYFTIISYEILE